MQQEIMDIWTAPQEKLQGNEVYWVFADKLDKELLCDFVEPRLNTSAKGQPYPVLVFTNSEFKEILVSDWKAEQSDAIKHYGTDRKKWIGKPFAIRIKNARPQLIAIEQKVE